MPKTDFPNPYWIHQLATMLVAAFGLDSTNKDLVRIAKAHIEAAFRDLVVNEGRIGKKGCASEDGGHDTASGTAE